MHIGAVPLVRLGDPLFDDENRAPHVLECHAIALPVGDNDCEICVQRGQMSRARRAASPM